MIVRNPDPLGKVPQRPCLDLHLGREGFHRFLHFRRRLEFEVHFCPVLVAEAEVEEVCGGGWCCCFRRCGWGWVPPAAVGALAVLEVLVGGVAERCSSSTDAWKGNAILAAKVFVVGFVVVGRNGCLGGRSGDWREGYK